MALKHIRRIACAIVLVPALVRGSLEAQDPAGRESALEAALEILDISESLEGGTRAIEEAYRRKDPEAIRPYLTHGRKEVRTLAVHRLGDLKDGGSAGVLGALLRTSKDEDLRAQAARSLSLLERGAGRPWLKKVLTDRNPRVRLHAATSFLGGAAGPSEIQGLLEAIDAYVSDEAGARAQAVLALHDEGDPSVLKPLAATPAGGPRFQQALVYTFQDLSPRLEEEARLRILGAALASPNKPLRRYAIQALGASHDPKALPLLRDAVARERDPGLVKLCELAVQALAPKPRGKLGESWARFVAAFRAQLTSAKTWFANLPSGLRLGLLGLPAGLALLFLAFRILLRRARSRRSRADLEAMLLPSGEVEEGTPLSKRGLESEDPAAESILDPELEELPGLASLYEDEEEERDEERAIPADGRNETRS